MLVAYAQIIALKNQELFWRLIPVPIYCIFNAFPRPPVAIVTESIVLRDYKFTSTWLYVNVTWTEPVLTYGKLTQYQIRIAREPIEPDHGGDPTNYPYIGTLNVSRKLKHYRISEDFQNDFIFGRTLHSKNILLEHFALLITFRKA